MALRESADGRIEFCPEHEADGERALAFPGLACVVDRSLTRCEQSLCVARELLAGRCERDIAAVAREERDTKLALKLSDLP